MYLSFVYISHLSALYTSHIYQLCANLTFISFVYNSHFSALYTSHINQLSIHLTFTSFICTSHIYQLCIHLTFFSFLIYFISTFSAFWLINCCTDQLYHMNLCQVSCNSIAVWFVSFDSFSTCLMIYFRIYGTAIFNTGPPQNPLCRRMLGRDTGIELRTVATFALGVRRSKLSARSYPCVIRFNFLQLLFFYKLSDTKALWTKISAASLIFCLFYQLSKKIHQIVSAWVTGVRFSKYIHSTFKK
jgi:hypothetical protein